jgi:hypothetical protein
VTTAAVLAAAFVSRSWRSVPALLFVLGVTIAAWCACTLALAARDFYWPPKR